MVRYFCINRLNDSVLPARGKTEVLLTLGYKPVIGELQDDLVCVLLGYSFNSLIYVPDHQTLEQLKSEPHPKNWFVIKNAKYLSKFKNKSEKMKDFLTGKTNKITVAQMNKLLKLYSENTAKQICEIYDIPYTNRVHGRLRVFKLHKQRSSANKSNKNAGVKVGSKRCACRKVIKDDAYTIQNKKRVCIGCPNHS